METAKYTRRSLDVEAVQITDENIEEVAAWCEGDVRTHHDKETKTDQKYVKVKVFNPGTNRQTKAFVGDWVLKAGKSLKVYPDRAFKKSFELKPTS